MVWHLFIAVPKSTRLNGGPYTPTTETVPPLRVAWKHQFSATDDPATFFA
jgi:hypothetical protein